MLDGVQSTRERTMRVFFTNLGCKLNQAEVDDLARRFVAAGHRLAPDLASADLHVVNSCTVTHLAARDSRKVARRGGRLHPGLRTVLTGCYATASPQEAAALAGVDLVVPNRDKDELVERVHRAFPEARPETAAGDELPVPYVPLAFGHARAPVKVEDGCNMRCAFCIIPATRGRCRSRPLEQVVAEVEALARGGYPEVVVTGVQISDYRDDAGHRLYDLVKALLERTAVPRLRLTSIAPWRFDPRLLELWQDPRLCRHLHLSLQSGSTATLRRMRRPYDAPRYAALVERIRRSIPGVAITTDVIVGFPGESEEDFADSLAFVERMAFARCHVFTYSPRPGTAAADFPDPVPQAVKKARTRALLEVARRSERAFRRAQLGARLTVAWEERKGGGWSGLSDNYVRVFAAADGDLSRRLSEVEVLALHPGGVAGRLPSPPPLAAAAPPSRPLPEAWRNVPPRLGG
ncbi:MAG: tRNA (N(6)-L-threonylcarbamoyladenosine(37)-C(2))-methylthiotransferase MtaB [Acidobacteria bacterium]|nr:MAG: tRNA (N(6)-L-threonylcarbamoyladenosine(37)-C(2))-methylthiotransferase MtaB [Acidobacteriota bacterium]